MGGEEEENYIVGLINAAGFRAAGDAGHATFRQQGFKSLRHRPSSICAGCLVGRFPASNVEPLTHSAMPLQGSSLGASKFIMDNCVLCHGSYSMLLLVMRVHSHNEIQFRNSLKLPRRAILDLDGSSYTDSVSLLAPWYQGQSSRFYTLETRN